MTHQDKLLADPDFNPEFSQFMDCSEITDWCVSLDEAETAARRSLFSPSSKRAFVVPRPPASPPLTRILEAFFSLSKHESRIQVSQDELSALDWLGLKSLTNIRAVEEDVDSLKSSDLRQIARRPKNT